MEHEYWKQYSDGKLADLARVYADELLARGVNISVVTDDDGNRKISITQSKELGQYRQPAPRPTRNEGDE